MQLLKAFLSMSLVYGVAHAQFSGDATWFNPGLGACGKVNTDNDLIVALSVSQYGNGSNCGRKIVANFQGHSVTVTVADKCIGCAANDIDLSPAAFSKLADLPVGRIHGVSWNFA